MVKKMEAEEGGYMVVEGETKPHAVAIQKRGGEWFG